MSVYDRDPRVRDLRGGHYDVIHGQHGEAFGRVFPMPDGRFGAKIHGHLDDPVLFATADAAIRSLVGDPT